MVIMREGGVVLSVFATGSSINTAQLHPSHIHAALCHMVCTRPVEGLTCLNIMTNSLLLGQMSIQCSLPNLINPHQSHIHAPDWSSPPHTLTPSHLWPQVSHFEEVLRDLLHMCVSLLRTHVLRVRWGLAPLPALMQSPPALSEEETKGELPLTLPFSPSI